MEIKNISSTTTLHNGVKMPVLGLGVYKTKNGSEVINAVHSSFEAGYRHIDTATFYKNEDGVGEAIRTGGVPREDLFIATKVWNDDHGREKTLKAFEASRQKLRLEYIDLYLIHWPVPGKYIETWQALETIYRQGRVRAIGVCNCLEHHLKEILKYGEIKPMVLQNEFHPRLVQQSLLDFSAGNDIQYESWSPLMRGRILENDLLKSIAGKHHKTTAQVVLRWNLQKGVITIPRSVHKSRIIENADVFDFHLTQEELQQIDSLDRGERTGAHPDNFLSHFSKR